MKKFRITILVLLGLLSSLEAQNTRVLIGSTLQTNPETLEIFLHSFGYLEDDGLDLEFFFVDHNTDPAASQLLAEYCTQDNCHLLKADAIDTTALWEPTPYTQGFWELHIWTIAAHKDAILEYALENDFDYVFLVDADIIVHPKSLNQLIAAEKEIIANVFWRNDEIPQVWLRDIETRFEVGPGESISAEEAEARVNAFIDQLREPGVHRVGGLGACTLISRSALDSGACFERMPNLSYYTEDSHFCIRAMAIGIPLYVDTHYPAYLYDPINPSGALEFLERCVE